MLLALATLLVGMALPVARALSEFLEVFLFVETLERTAIAGVMPLDSATEGPPRARTQVSLRPLSSSWHLGTCRMSGAPH